MAVAAVLAFSISPLSSNSAPGEVVVASSGRTGAQGSTPRVTGAVSSGATVTDTHTSVRVTATVAPEHLRAAVSERALESFAPLDSREWLPEAPGKRWADGTRPSASLPDAFAAEFQSRPETHAELQLAAGTASGSRGRCRSARVGLAWYRQRQRDWLTLRSRTHNSRAVMSLGRQPRNCADARHLAQVAKRRSFAARQAYGRWLERHTLRDFRVTPDSNAWQKAVQEAQRVFPGTSSWLWNCSAAEGGHGRWVRYGGGSYYPGYEHTDQVGNWMQYRWSTFRGHYRHALDGIRSSGFRVAQHLRDPGNVRAWLSPLATALAGGWARFTGNDDSHWSASWGNGC